MDHSSLFSTAGGPLNVSQMEMAAELSDKSDHLNEDVYDDGYLRVEHHHYYVSCGGEIIKLPRTEFLILSRLVRSVERIVPSEEIWKYAWRTDKPIKIESLHVYMYRLRAQLLPYGLRIETMVNVGYRLMIEKKED
jgi:DNA-binding response OmpR family regulator